MSSSMSIETICNKKMNKALASFGEDVARSVIELLSSKYGFPLDEALSSFSVMVSEKRQPSRRDSRPSSRVSSRSSAAPSMLPIPFCGKSVHGWCSGIRPNGGLYTQCSNEPDGDSPYCATCQRQASKNEHGLPNGGDIGERIAKGDEWRCPKGKAPIRLANYLKKSGKELTDGLRGDIIEAAESFGWTISDDEWVVKSASRGRPRKTKTAVVDTTATEDEGNKSPSKGKKTARKAKKTNSGSELENASDSSDGEELVLGTPSKSSLVKRRTTQSPGVISPIDMSVSGSISPVEVKEAPKPKKQRKPKMSPEEKEAAKVAKAEERRLKKEAENAAKAAEKEAAKAAKAAAKLAEKEAAKAAKAAAKLAEKEAAKAAKLAEKEATKAAKLAEKEAAKEKVASPSSPSPSDDGDGSAHKQCGHKDADGNRCSTPSDGDGNTHCIKHSRPEPAVPADPEHDVYEAVTEDEANSDDDADSDEDANSDDEDAAGVEEFEYKGKKYLRDPNTNDIFDLNVFMETGDAKEIGVYDPKKDEIEFHEEK